VKLDAIKQEPKERVQRYFERLDRLFQRGRIPDAEQRQRFLARLKPKIRKLCVVRNFANIEELVGVATELERVLGELGETPFKPLKEEQEEGVAETSMEHQVAALNNTLINFFKGSVPNSIPSSSSTLLRECQIYKGRDHIATTCPRLNEPRPKCAICGMPHRTKNCGVKCSFCSGLGHSEDKCWRKSKDGKSHSGAANFLEMLLNDEAATLQQLNELCGDENVFSYTRIPRRRMPVELPPANGIPSTEVAEDSTVVNRESSIRSKILSHFIKGKISLTPMETVMMIPGELDQLENLVKVTRRKKDAEIASNQVSMVAVAPTLRRICINKTHKSKTLHLLVEINSYLIEGLVDTGASMFVMAAAVIKELGMMHLVAGSETYKTASGIVTQAMGRIDEVSVKARGVPCTMTFMVVDTDSYDILLGLDFLIKIGAIVDVERGLIQVRRGPGPNVEVLPLTMVNFLQALSSKALMQNDSRLAERFDVIMGKPCVDEDIKTQQLGERVSSSDSDTTEDFEEEHQRLRPISEESEFGDTELEELVLMEGPQQILQLTLQEQADHFMKEETADADDYADWIKWVADVEQRKQVLSGGVVNAEVPVLLQVQQLNDATPCRNFKDQTVSTGKPGVSSRWRTSARSSELIRTWTN
jgi:predicted aspartyl protease